MARRSKKWATSASGSQWPDESRAAHVSNGKMSILAVDRVGAMAPEAVQGAPRLLRRAYALTFGPWSTRTARYMSLPSTGIRERHTSFASCTY